MRTIQRVASTTTAVLMLAVVGCSTQSRVPADDTTNKPTTGAPSATPAASPGPARDTSKIAQLEAEARALAKMTGCNADGGCRTAPVGERACGGPRDYIVYCAATTDSVALFKKLDELKAAEIEFNKSSNAMSTCEFRMAPKTAAIGGRCKAAGAP